VFSMCALALLQHQHCIQAFMQLHAHVSFVWTSHFA